MSIIRSTIKFFLLVSRFISRSHAPAWEHLGQRARVAVLAGYGRVHTAFPRGRVGTRKQKSLEKT